MAVKDYEEMTYPEGIIQMVVVDLVPVSDAGWVWWVIELPVDIHETLKPACERVP
jgi:hypothetical protein